MKSGGHKSCPPLESLRKSERYNLEPLLRGGPEALAPERPGCGVTGWFDDLPRTEGGLGAHPEQAIGPDRLAELVQGTIQAV
jgi:hypothetical protein